jgi:hypothetical protein
MKIKILSILLFLVSVNAFAFTQLTGTARDVTDGWVIGTDTQGSGFGIYRWDGTGWTKTPGSAVRIGGTYRMPWAVNDINQTFRWTGSTWQLMPGSARDIADGWKIGTDAQPGGFGIYRWNGAQWIKMPGSAVRIGGTYTTPWVVNNESKIFRWNGSAWVLLPGSAFDVGDGWIIGTSAQTGGFSIHRWNGSSWVKTAGSATVIGGAGGTPWVINHAGNIFRW